MLEKPLEGFGGSVDGGGGVWLVHLDEFVGGGAAAAVVMVHVGAGEVEEGGVSGCFWVW